jgi:hypothetical protein
MEKLLRKDGRYVTSRRSINRRESGRPEKVGINTFKERRRQLLVPEQFS